MTNSTTSGRCSRSPGAFVPTRRAVLGHILATLAAIPARGESSGEAGLRILEAREGSLRLLPEPAAETLFLAYDGRTPGPLLRYRQGDEIALRLVNKLDVPATFAIQGLRVPGPMAGIGGLSQSAVLPGQSFDYRFPARIAGLSWYHSHVLPRTAEQIGRGLYGALIIDEPKPPAADRDILIFLAEWALDDEARLLVGAAASARQAAATRLTVNSQPPPLREIAPPRSRIRLRIVSCVSSQAVAIGFAGTKPMVLAVDGTACEAFQPARDTIPVGPGALYDLVLDLPSEAGDEVHVSMRGDPELRLLTVTTEGAAREALPPVASLELDPSLPKIIKLEAARRADLVIEAAAEPGHWKLNGAAVTGFPEKPLFEVKRGTPVSLGFVNRTTRLHQIRVHGHYLRLLHDLDDGWEPYWRNCVLVAPGKTKRIAFVADAPGKWPIEGLMYESRSFGLATWFAVT
jgi:FtsP/CotA-like multicopper oxidase with cupredoxin domain